MAVSGRPVVVGTDFSSGAAGAWAQAQELASALGSEVVLVHVVEGGGEWQPDAEAGEWLAAHGIAPDRIHVRHGTAWVELTRFAGDHDACLLVLGSHGRTGYQPLALGATAARVTVQSRSPVVVVSARVAETDRAGVQKNRRGVAAQESRQGPGNTVKPTEVGTR